MDMEKVNMEENNIPKVYDPKSFEKKWYGFWEENKLFHAVVDEEKQPYSIVIPPPNVTGQLHMGHALDNTLQDILIRWRRMQRYNTLWMPGCDHAGIATQAKVEGALREEGTNRYELGREKFLERVWQWKEKFGSRIMSQLRSLGSSLDWDRERFTMDEGCSRAVREVFVSLYEKGLVSQEEAILKSDFMGFIRRFERENDNILEFGTAIPYSDKIKNIYQTLLEYAKQRAVSPSRA